MKCDADLAKASEGDLIVALVGLTAGWRKRRAARRHLRRHFGACIHVPWIPYPLGLRFAAAWIARSIDRRLSRSGGGTVHVLAYLGGGILLRDLHASGKSWPIARTVWNRGPLQEQVARALVKRVPPFFLTLAGYRSIVDLARKDVAGLPFPPSALDAGVIVETRASGLARWLGIGPDPLELTPDQIAALMPGAGAAIALPLSHDDVYDDPLFFEQAAAFLKTGRFVDQPPDEIR